MIIFILILLGIIILIMLLQYHNSKNNDKLYSLKLNNQFGNNDISSYDSKRLIQAPDYFRRHGSEWQIDDITWNDLSMDRLFCRMDTAQSDIGSQLLYYYLRTPKLDRASVSSVQDNISFWIDNPELRNSIAVSISHCGWMKRFSLFDHLDAVKELKTVSRAKYIRLIVCLLLSFGSVFFIDGFGIILFIFVLIHNMIIYYRDRMKIAPYLAVMDHICRLIDSGEDTVKILRTFSENKNMAYPKEEELRRILLALKPLKKKNGFINNMGGNGNPIAAVFDLIGSLFYLDIFRFQSMKDCLEESLESIDGLITLIGTIDAEIVMAGYVFSMKDRLVKPDLDGKPGCIQISELTHPLLEDPVANSVSSDKSILLTGANASGKSTFLKSVALAAVMAQTIGYVCARSYRAPIFICMSSMSLNDDITNGDSYYMAEIKAVKRMMDSYEKAGKEGYSFICFVDELLRGTNTVERIAASAQIMKKLDEAGMFVCSATHDLELTGLLDNYDNYHFEEDLSGGDVCFSYKLKKGPAVSRNAIKLLGMMGFDKDIVDEAENMVLLYEKTGTWSQK